MNILDNPGRRTIILISVLIMFSLICPLPGEAGQQNLTMDVIQDGYPEWIEKVEDKIIISGYGDTLGKMIERTKFKSQFDIKVLLLSKKIYPSQYEYYRKNSTPLGIMLISNYTGDKLKNVSVDLKLGVMEEPPLLKLERFYREMEEGTRFVIISSGNLSRRILKQKRTQSLGLTADVIFSKNDKKVSRDYSLSELTLMPRSRVHSEEQIGSFITPSSAYVDRFVRGVLGYYLKKGHSSAEKATIIFNALYAYGFRYERDPGIEKFQLPQELFKNRIGDCDDFVILLASCLSNVQIPLRFVFTYDKGEGHVILEAGQVLRKKAKKHIMHYDPGISSVTLRSYGGLPVSLYLNWDYTSPPDTLWFPIETTMLANPGSSGNPWWPWGKENFLKAVRKGGEWIRDSTDGAVGRKIVLNLSDLEKRGYSAPSYPPEEDFRPDSLKLPSKNAINDYLLGEGWYGFWSGQPVYKPELRDPRLRWKIILAIILLFIIARGILSIKSKKVEEQRISPEE